MIFAVILGAALALLSAEVGFWFAVWAMREAKGRPAFAKAEPPAAQAEALFEALL